MTRYRTIIAFLIAPLPIPILLSAGLQALDFADKSPPPSLIGFLEGIFFFQSLPCRKRISPSWRWEFPLGWSFVITESVRGQYSP
jgi:hypothetical protein